MSTLTSSPSPVASPRAFPCYSASQRPTKSPKLPPFVSPSLRPRGSVPSTESVPSSSPRLSRTSTAKPQTADAGTQYTPEFLPPTAPPQTAGSKRKDSAPPTSMTTLPTGDISGPPAPPEPEAGAATGVQHGEATPSNLSSRPAADDADPVDADMSPSATKRARTTPGVKTMPLKYETCNPKDLGYLISSMLMELIRLNDGLPLNGRLTRFHSRAPPGISCHDYLQRLIQHATLSPPILLSMVYYIDRLCAMYPAFNVSSLTVHRFLITAATVASKGLSDSFWTNPTYARIGGITTGELATLEMEFLQKVQWRIVPKPEVLVDYYMSLVQRSEGYELEHVTPSTSTTTTATTTAAATPEAPPPEVENNHKMETDPP